MLIMLVILLTSGLLLADDYTVGTGTSTENYVPLYGYNNYGWSKFFYTGDEFADAGLTGTVTINKIAFYVGNTVVDYQTDSQTVYMRHSYDDAYASSATSYPGTSGFSQVFSGSITWQGGSWVEITLSTPFTYNSTWNLEILWENRDGSKISGPPKFAYTSTSSNYRAVYKFQDSSFPTTSGTRYYNRPNIRVITPATDVPNPAIAVLPADAATNIEIDTQLRWAANGGEPDQYRIYFGMDNPPSNLIAGDIVTSTTYDIPYYLHYATTYYWRIVPHNSFGYAMDCPVWSFTTRDDPTITVLPWVEDLNGAFAPTNWTTHSGTLSDPITLGTDGSGGWQQDDWLNISGTEDKAARMEFWSTQNGWLITPPILISSDNCVLQFDAALLKNGQTPTGTPPALTGVDDRFAVLIGDGFSWTTADILREWNNSGSPYVLSNIAITGQTITIPLTGHIGGKRIAFFAGSTELNADNDFMINNVRVKEMLPTPELQICSSEADNMITLSWDDVPNATYYRIYKALSPDSEYTLIDTTSSTQYQMSITANKGFFKVEASNTVMK